MLLTKTIRLVVQWGRKLLLRITVQKYERGRKRPRR